MFALGGWLAANVIQALSIQYGSEGLYLAGLAAGLSVKIWSIVDATRVAKVKNMYERDLMRLASVDFEMYPSVNYIRTSDGLQPTAGLTLAMKF